ncbi:MAG: 4Fe-4S dicluster domain-containing protein, partial [Desulfobacula sp.]|nr:4Fe-4S dicluster domain-containing protein [Desulfobacula sp.]
VVSCVYPVEENIIVRTRSEKVDRIRKTIIELLMAHAPDSPQLQELAQEYGANRDRYERDPSFCIHCGLCVRYCAEVKKKNAIGFIDRGINKEICFIPEIAAKECNDCKECFELCPTSYLQAAFVLAQALAFPSDND